MSLPLTALRAAATLARHTPPPLARGLAEGAAVGVSRLGAATRRAAWRERRTMLGRHLARVTGASGRDLRRLTDRAIASYARYWADSLRIPVLQPADIAAGIRYDGYERIAAGLDGGKGVILALPHLGGWEWAGAHLASIGHPVSVVVERLEPADLFDWFVTYRAGLGMDVIPVGPGSAARCTRALASNHILCLLSDRLLAGSSGVVVEFFGEVTEFPAGPAALALRSGAPILPAAVYFEEATDGHLGFVAPALDTARRGSLREDVARVTGDLARSFEALIRRAPAQWHLLQPNWPSDGGLYGGPRVWDHPA